MARRSVPPPKHKSPILTVGQKRRRIERLQKCITSLEAFDPQKARKRAPAVLELEAAIDKATARPHICGTIRRRHSTPTPLLHMPRAALSCVRSVGQRRDAKAHEVSRNFSENKERSIALLRKAIGTLEDEIADASLVVATKQSTATPIIEAAQESKPTPTAWRRVARWWRGRD
jgi:hypothetical protein